MSARDDYYLMALHADDELAPPGKRNEIREALAEIDRHRQWKAEATEVIAGWERLYEACGSPGPLGGSKSENLLEALRGDGIL